MKVIHTLAVASLLFIGAPVLADDAQSANPQMVAEAHAAACTKLSPISDEQRKQLSALRDKYELDTAEKKALLHVTGRQLKQVMTSVTVDKSAALALQSKLNALRDDLSNARLSFMLSAGDVFTPEQRAQFKAMRRQGHHRHHGHFEGRESGAGKPSVG